MLFIRSNSFAVSLSGSERLRLLKALAARGLKPLVRSARQHLFQSLAGQGRDAAQLEIECAALDASAPGRAFTPGELFCADGCVLFNVFGDGATSAGVIYDIETKEPLSKLVRFCGDVREALDEIGVAATQAEHSAQLTRRESESETSPSGLARFMSLQPADFLRAEAAFRGGRGLARASELMEERAVRKFLRGVEQMRREGFTPRRLFAEAASLGVSVERMMEAGLLEPEVRVSCRKSGHALFDLPSPDSLAAITISKAKCSLCAAPVADEVIEQTINPTRLAVSLLEDGRWLANRVYKIVRSLGVPESEIATGPASPHGESYLVADVCGNSFLFVTRDGDMTPAFCRRVAEMVEETGAAHLVVVFTGAAEDEGRMRLYEFAWRRARDGRDLGMTLVEGLDSARAQIEGSFALVVRRELSRALFSLDAALGFSASNFVLGWFRLTRAAGAGARSDDVQARVRASARR
ncbi:MAG TPA: hypothetical protein VLJ61_06780 [Pyrinomonadaceae bacterium]|nr:hypothetical protein [Pyrinomonadaceae bacterium]